MRLTPHSEVREALRFSAVSTLDLGESKFGLGKSSGIIRGADATDLSN